MEAKGAKLKLIKPVGEEFHLDPEKPLESIAQKLMLSPPMRLFGALDSRALNTVIQGIKEYKIDGAVNFTHLGCRHMGPVLKIYKDVLSELDVPVMAVDCDLVDPTITSADEVCNKLEQFFEQLEDR
jgi:benzoyl-CoA reductase/2-hydroxyglutaryl-CoA dehydratase subunit BcrC/BadD/HgdB